MAGERSGGGHAARVMTPSVGLVRSIAQLRPALPMHQIGTRPFIALARAA